MKETSTSLSPTTKSLTTSYSRARYKHVARYIHKYYLSRALQPRIFLADIIAIMHELDDWNVFKNELPERAPCCVVHYEDLLTEKVIPSREVELVLHAIASYYDDWQCELTEDEKRAAVNLNTWLTEWEKRLLSECVRRTEEMELRVKSIDPWLTDYEIDIEVQFYIRDDDPYSEDNNPDVNEYDVDSDAALLCSTVLLMDSGQIFAKESTSPDYWGIGDGQDHKESCSRNGAIFQDKYCSTFHDLYSRLGVPMKHMGRIGRVYADIKVFYQNGVSIDLAGDQPVAAQDEPRIRSRHQTGE